MSRAEKSSSVLTVRIDSDLTRSLDLEARRRHTTKSKLVRELLVDGLNGGKERNGLEEEARRQSLLVSGRRSEQDALDFLEQVADTQDWR